MELHLGLESTGTGGAGGGDEKGNKAKLSPVLLGLGLSLVKEQQSKLLPRILSYYMLSKIVRQFP